MIVRVLTDDKGTAFCASGQLAAAGLRYHVTHTIRDFMASVPLDDSYVLMVDYFLEDRLTSRPLLATLLACGEAPQAVIVMSGYPTFEDELEWISAQYTNCDIPFHFLPKPFGQRQLEDILQKIKSAHARGMVRKIPNTEFALLSEYGVYIPKSLRVFDLNRRQDIK